MKCMFLTGRSLVDRNREICILHKSVLDGLFILEHCVKLKISLSFQWWGSVQVLHKPLGGGGEYDWKCLKYYNLIYLTKQHGCIKPFMKENEKPIYVSRSSDQPLDQDIS